MVIDILVVGAGPAGVAAAIELRRAGREVVLVDKAEFPRDKCCGDGLTTLALRELERLGFDPAAVPGFRIVDGAVLRSPSGRTFKVPLPAGTGIYAAVAPRLQLDGALVELAVATGVDVRLGHAVKSVAIGGGVAVVGAEGLGDLTARHVVAADGMWSPTRKALGVSTDGYLGEWHAFRQYVGGVSGIAADELIVWFDADLLPGYAWSFPLPNGRANVGFGVLRDGSRGGRDAKLLAASLLERPHIAAALGAGAIPEGRQLAWPIPARIDRAVLDHGPVLFAGDAAAATDVMTGEGIGQALLTGRLAAEAIAEGGTADAVAARYRRRVHAELVADHRLSALLGRVLRHPRGANAALAIVAHSRTWGRRNFARWMFEDEPRAIAVTPQRWHRRFLARPGAYAADGRAAMRTRLTDLLGIEHPVMCAGMGGVSYHRLVAAVSEAGGIGTLGASTMRATELAEEIAGVRAMTSKPFGVDLLTALPDQVEAGVRHVIEGGATLFVAGLGVPRDIVEALHDAGVIVASMCGKVRHAVAAVASGCDFVVAQGTEAGGHTGTVATMALVPQVVDAVGERVPVVAAGGIFDGRGLAASLALGADGVWIGTRFIATPEARSVAGYKEALVASAEDSTVVTRAYTGKTCRVLRNDWTQHFDEHPDELAPFPAQVLASMAAGANHLGAADGTEVDVRREFFPAGQGVGAIESLVPAGELVRQIVDDAERVLDALR